MGRSHVREALRKLEFYGYPPDAAAGGTVVAGLGITAGRLDLQDVLKMENSDFASLVETRVLLETRRQPCRQRRSSEDIAGMQQALAAYEKK